MSPFVARYAISPLNADRAAPETVAPNAAAKTAKISRNRCTMGCFCQTGASPWSSAPHRADCGAAILHDLEHRFQRQRVDVASGAVRPTRRSSPPACSTVRVMRVRRGARRLSWGTRWRRRRAALSARFESVRTSGRRCSGSASCQRGGRSPIDPPQVCVERPLTPTVRTAGRFKSSHPHSAFGHVAHRPCTAPCVYGTGACGYQ